MKKLIMATAFTGLMALGAVSTKAQTGTTMPKMSSTLTAEEKAKLEINARRLHLSPLQKSHMLSYAATYKADQARLLPNIKNKEGMQQYMNAANNYMKKCFAELTPAQREEWKKIAQEEMAKAHPDIKPGK